MRLREVSGFERVSNTGAAMRFRELLVEHVTARRYPEAIALVRAVAQGTNSELVERLLLAARTGNDPETIAELIGGQFSAKTSAELSGFNCLLLILEARGPQLEIRVRARRRNPDGSTRTLLDGAEETVRSYSPGSIDKGLAEAGAALKDTRWAPLLAPGLRDRTRRLERESGLRIGEMLVRTGFIEESKLTDFLSKQYGVPAINLDAFDISPEVIGLVPIDTALKHRVVPLNVAGRSLIVAMADPSNIYAIDDLAFVTGFMTIEPVVAAEPAIFRAIDRWYNAANVPGTEEAGGGERGRQPELVTIPGTELYAATHFAALAEVLDRATERLTHSTDWSRRVERPFTFLARWLVWEGDVGQLRCEWTLHTAE